MALVRGVAAVEARVASADGRDAAGFAAAGLAVARAGFADGAGGGGTTAREACVDGAVVDAFVRAFATGFAAAGDDAVAAGFALRRPRDAAGVGASSAPVVPTRGASASPACAM